MIPVFAIVSPRAACWACSRVQRPPRRPAVGISRRRTSIFAGSIRVARIREAVDLLTPARLATSSNVGAEFAMVRPLFVEALAGCLSPVNRGVTLHGNWNGAMLPVGIMWLSAAPRLCDDSVYHSHVAIQFSGDIRRIRRRPRSPRPPETAYKTGCVESFCQHRPACQVPHRPARFCRSQSRLGSPPLTHNRREVHNVQPVSVSPVG